MNYGFSRVVLATFCISLCASCGLFTGKYKMEIRPVAGVESQLQSLYVIVSPANEVAEPLLTSSNYGQLLEEDRIRKYDYYVQYELEEGVWKQVYVGQAQSKHVTLKEKNDVLKVTISHNLIKSSGNIKYTAVVLALFPVEGFDAAVVKHATLNSKTDQTLQVSTGNLSLTDS